MPRLVNTSSSEDSSDSSSDDQEDDQEDDDEDTGVPRSWSNANSMTPLSRLRNMTRMQMQLQNLSSTAASASAP